MNLLENERFQKEFLTFKEKISKLSNLELQKELMTDLNVLVNSIKKIEQLHSEIPIRKQIPFEAVDYRRKISEIRKKLDRKLRDSQF